MAETNAIRVHYWAAAKAAAGTEADELVVEGPISLVEVREAAAALHPGTRLAAILEVCSVVVGEQPVGTADPATFLIEPGATVEFLPPFAGG